jgi:multiple sugar transport system permease protein
MKKKSLVNYEKYWAIFMSIPGLIILITFVFAPLVLSLGWSVTNKRLISPIPTKITGIDNYSTMLSIKRIKMYPNADSSYPELRKILRNNENTELNEYSQLLQFERGDHQVIWLAKDPLFWKALWNTLRFVLVIVPCQGGLALLLATLVNQKLRGSTFFRMIFFAPVVTSMSVIAIIWIFILNQNQGILNGFIDFISRGKISPIPWLTDLRFAPISIYIVSIWQSVGFQMIIFLAGLQEIPGTLYESAGMDGATKIQQFRLITLPMLKNTTIFVIISTTILAFRVFTQIDVMTKGGPQESTMSLIYYIVQKGFREQRIGYASAMTFVFFSIVLLISLLQKLLMKSEKEIA